MSYQSIVEMAGSNSLLMRVTAAAAQEGATEPSTFAQIHMWHLASSTDWVQAWDYAKGAATVNNNPDIGARDDVINDAMILAAVQPLLSA
jgi:hypothetical protein